MRCTYRVVEETRRRKRSGTPYTTVTPVQLNSKKGETCGGRILVKKLDVVEEPTWGGTYASMETEYRCERCGLPPSVDLPRDTDDLLPILQAYLDSQE